MSVVIDAAETGAEVQEMRLHPHVESGVRRQPGRGLDRHFRPRISEGAAGTASAALPSVLALARAICARLVEKPHGCRVRRCCRQS